MANIVKRYKERLVAKGYTQTEDIDYFDTFSSVAKMTTIRLLLSLAFIYNWKLKKLGIRNAFLHGELKECIHNSSSWIDFYSIRTSLLIKKGFIWNYASQQGVVCQTVILFAFCGIYLIYE